MQRHAAAKDQRIVSSLSASAEERYVEFLRLYPSIALRVRQTMLASYLGMSPETVSRIRKSLSRLCECYAMPGSSDELMHVFFARELTRRDQALDLGEVIHEVRPFPLAELDAMIERREIRDAKTLVGIFYALRRRRTPTSR